MPFKPAPGFRQRIQATPEFRSAMKDQAGTVARAVQAAASGFKRTGRYAGSIEVQQDAAETHVVTTDPFGHLVEWGSRNNPAYAPLRRGARAAGARLEEQ